ncbi:hypothetical protein GE061_006980 [Apolygus lucorum]|uniref:BTB domain-containing protein n=1 Tax=Apolygus lucorum TaxID=248454 RepID=A0A8S9WQM6_APOLU|nr:hypothetical protein GE061_006980 [Apolygus lucorum]
MTQFRPVGDRPQPSMSHDSTTTTLLSRIIRATSQVEMIIENLRLWPVLHHLSKESLSDIAYLITYGGNGNVAYGSALYITKNGDVFASGTNSFCGKYSKQTEIIEGGGEFLKGSVKVDELSGINMKKIVQGLGFSVGLSADNGLYLFGNASSSIMLRKEYIIMYESYTPDTLCKKCSISEYSPCTIGGFTLNKCADCDWYPTYSHQTPKSLETPVRAFMEFCDMVVVLCSKCGQWCSFMAAGDFDLYFCTTCKTLQESIGWCEEFSVPCKVQLNTSLKVVDVACGAAFLVMLTASNDLILLGDIGCNYQGYINNVEDVVIKKVYCGGNHIAVVTNKDELYTCGDGSAGQLGYAWNLDMGYTTLRKVSLPGRVVKMCCSLSSTACLLTDGSVAFLGGDAKSSIIMLREHTFVDLACATLSHLFSAKAISSEVFFWKSPNTKLHLAVDAKDCIEALVGWPITYDTSQSKIEFLKKKERCDKHGYSHYAQFFGHNQFSDFTLKLKDGDFPCHRIVLFNRSDYFKKLFTASEDHNVHDMTSHDPLTCKNLLKFFYQGLFEELHWRDVLDLYILAHHYEESEVLVYTLREIYDKLDSYNVLEINRVAESKNLTDLIDACRLELLSHPIESIQTSSIKALKAQIRRFRKMQSLGLVTKYKDGQSSSGKWLRYAFGLPYCDPMEVGDAFCEWLLDKPDELEKGQEFLD